MSLIDSKENLSVSVCLLGLTLIAPVVWRSKLKFPTTWRFGGDLNGGNGMEHQRVLMVTPFSAMHLPIRDVSTAVAAPIKAVCPSLVIRQRQWYFLCQIWTLEL